jgi:hypothetical protein
MSASGSCDAPVRPACEGVEQPVVEQPAVEETVAVDTALEEAPEAVEAVAEKAEDDVTAPHLGAIQRTYDQAMAYIDHLARCWEGRTSRLGFPPAADPEDPDAVTVSLEVGRVPLSAGSARRAAA